MSTQPSEAHRKLAAEILFTYSVSGAARPSAIVAAAQLLRDSEARSVEAAFPDSGDDSLYNVRRLRAELAAERERVRVLSEAIEAHKAAKEYRCQCCDLESILAPCTCFDGIRMLTDADAGLLAALAATEGKQ